jgi:hypothetical protein
MTRSRVIPVQPQIVLGTRLGLPSLVPGDFYRFHTMVKPSGSVNPV